MKKTNYLIPIIFILTPLASLNGALASTYTFNSIKTEVQSLLESNQEVSTSEGKQVLAAALNQFEAGLQSIERNKDLLLSILSQAQLELNNQTIGYPILQTLGEKEINSYKTTLSANTKISNDEKQVLQLRFKLTKAIILKLL